MKHCFAYIVLLLLVKLVNGQPIYFKHYQVEDGLANNTVFSIFQDERGFMWFGTKEGLNRFDGGAFKAFNMTQDSLREIKEFVYSLDQGLRKTLWVGTRKGLYEFDPRKEIFSLLPRTRDTEILNIRSDNKGKIWFTSDLRLYCFDEKKRKMRFYNLQTNRSHLTTAICLQPDGTVWTCSVDGYLFRYEMAADTFICVNNTAAADRGRLKEVNRIFFTPQGGLLVGTITELSYFDLQKGTYRQLLGPQVEGKPVYVRDIIGYSPEECWMATESGVYTYNFASGKVTNLRKEDSNPYAISDNAVYALYKDTEGGIWCGTYFGGVNYFHSQHSYFKKYFRSTDENSLSGNAVRELCEDPFGNLWIGTEDAGLNKLNLQTGAITRITLPPGERSFPSNIHGLLVDGNELWVGTFQQGLHILDLRTGRRLRQYNAEEQSNGLNTNFVITFCKTRAGEILLGTNGGVYRYLRQTKRFEPVMEFPESSYVFSLLEDYDGTLWAATIGNGLYYFNPATKEKGNFLYDPANSNSLGNNSVCGIFQDSHLNLWLSTEGGGVCRLSKDRRTFTRFNTDSGLPSNMVFKVLEDKNKHLWISTSKGLTRYDPLQGSWKVFTKAHGLLTDQFNYSSGYRSPEGTLYFGSVKGMISFLPNTIVSDPQKPNVYITSFQVNNLELPINGSPLQRAVTYTDTVLLKYDQSSFSIGFAALTYIAPEMTQYAYRMDGLDKDWTWLKTNRRIYFTDLSPGAYTLRIRTADSNGEWLKKETTLFIKISPPFWLSPLAYVLYGLLVLAIIYLVAAQYHNRIKEKNKRRIALFEQEKEKEIYRAKIEFFTNVAHEIRTPLTLIKGPLETVIDKVGEEPGVKKSLKSIERNTERLITLTDQLLDFRTTENIGFSLSFVKTNIPKLVKENCLNFIGAAEKKGISLEMDLPGKSFHAFVDIEAFHKIMSNLMGNAIKYAAEKVMVRLSSPGDEDSLFTLEVSNDGVLIPWSMREKIFEPFFRVAANEQPGSGIGLALARALADLHNGTLALQKVENGLNVFLLTLPIHQKIEFKLSTAQKKS